MLIELAREIGEMTIHHLGDDGIELNRSHCSASKIEGRQNVPASTRSDYKRRSSTTEVVDKACNVIRKVL